MKSHDNPKRSNKSKGQRKLSREKYGEAINACDSSEFIDCNVSQIARMYGLDGTALANQLRAHFPDVIPKREAERRRMGIADNIHRGVRPYAEEAYAEAVKLLSRSDISVKEAAELCGVSESGLRQHLLYYHKKLVKNRSNRHEEGMMYPRAGTASGNGSIRRVSDEKIMKYAEAVEMYRTTSLPVTEICRRLDLSVSSFRNHLRLWHRALMFERRGAVMSADSLSDREAFETKRYCPAAAEKYARAIEELRRGSGSLTDIAASLGLKPDMFRRYLKEHAPDLWEREGMMQSESGKRIKRRTNDKYALAVELYRCTTEPLKSIARRLGLQYNSLSSFVRRNCRDAIEAHKLCITKAKREPGGDSGNTPPAKR